MKQVKPKAQINLVWRETLEALFRLSATDISISKWKISLTDLPLVG